MGHADQREKGHFEAEISEDAVREAVAAVERHEAPPAGETTPAEGGEGAVTVEPPAPEEAEAVAPAERLAAELAETRAELEMSQAKGRETFERLKESHERHLRAVAELENYKKRAGREREELVSTAVAALLRDLLPVVDNLDRALAHSGGEMGPLARGVAATRKLFVDTLAKFGVEGFRAQGEPFDPTRHEAMQRLPTDAVPPGRVAEEIAPGWLFKGRLLRPALVAVAVAPEPSPSVKTAAPAIEATAAGIVEEPAGERAAVEPAEEAS